MASSIIAYLPFSVLKLKGSTMMDEGERALCCSKIPNCGCFFPEIAESVVWPNLSDHFGKTQPWEIASDLVLSLQSEWTINVYFSRNTPPHLVPCLGSLVFSDHCDLEMVIRRPLRLLNLPFVTAVGSK